MRRIVEVANGERFIETPLPFWKAALDRYYATDDLCPLPLNHRIFNRPSEYGAVLISGTEADPRPERSRGSDNQPTGELVPSE